MELLTRKLENESNLHRRVDLFFLVDSITQCSHSQKGYLLLLMFGLLLLIFYFYFYFFYSLSLGAISYRPFLNLEISYLPKHALKTLYIMYSMVVFWVYMKLIMKVGGDMKFILFSMSILFWEFIKLYCSDVDNDIVFCGFDT